MSPAPQLASSPATQVGARDRDSLGRCCACAARGAGHLSLCKVQGSRIQVPTTWGWSIDLCLRLK